MPKKSKTRIASKNKTKFQFHWWMGLGLVLLVALIGIVIIRFSNASVKSEWIQGHFCEWNSGTPSCTLDRGNTFEFQNELSTGGSVWVCKVGNPTYTSGKYQLTSCYLAK